MRALSLFVLCLLATSISHADLYVDVPADEAAAARMPAPSKAETCQRHINAAYDQWQRRQRLSKAQWESTPEKQSYLAAKCGNTNDFNAALVAELNRRPSLEDQEFKRKLSHLKREAAADEAKKKKCDSIVIGAVGEASRSRMTIFSQNEYVKAGCGDRAAFSKAYSENLTSLPARIGRGILSLGTSAGRSIAGAAKSGLSLLNQIRPSGDASSQSDAALSKSMDSSN